MPLLPLADFYDNRTLNFAHRGARMQAPENTLPAFERAIATRADGIELDVQLTVDNQIVVFHDHQLGRTAKATGKICDWPLAYLRELDAGEYFSADFRGTRIPTLAEVFEVVGRQLLINIEIKPFVDRRVVPILVDLIDQHRLEQRVIISSFSLQMLRAMRRHDPHLPIGLLIDSSIPNILQRDLIIRKVIGAYQARHPNVADTDADYVRWAHNHGYRVNVWTVNEPDEIRDMLALGVDMIISDVPDIVDSIRNQDLA